MPVGAVLTPPAGERCGGFRCIFPANNSGNNGADSAGFGWLFLRR